MINVHISKEVSGKCAKKYRKIAWNREMCFCLSFKEMLISVGLDDRWEYKCPGASMLSICIYHLSQDKLQSSYIVEILVVLNKMTFCINSIEL